MIPFSPMMPDITWALENMQLFGQRYTSINCSLLSVWKVLVHHHHHTLHFLTKTEIWHPYYFASRVNVRSILWIIWVKIILMVGWYWLHFFWQLIFKVTMVSRTTSTRNKRDPTAKTLNTLNIYTSWHEWRRPERWITCASHWYISLFRCFALHYLLQPFIHRTFFIVGWATRYDVAIGSNKMISLYTLFLCRSTDTNG